MTGHLQAGSEIQVGGEVNSVLKCCIGVGIIGTVAGIGIAFFDLTWAVVVSFISIVLFLVTAVTATLHYRQRAWLLDTGNGFVYRTPPRSETFADEDVISIQLNARNLYKQGELSGVCRVVTMKLASRNAPLKLSHTVSTNASDPLSGFLQRTIDGYRLRAAEALQAGARLEGPGWSIGNDDLTITGKEPHRVAIKDIITMDTIDGLHNVWRAGESAPLLSISQDSENAFLLELLLRPKIAEFQKERAPDPSAPGLGRPLFQRAVGATGRFFATFVFWIGWLVLAAGVGMLIVGNDGVRTSGAFCAGTAVVAILVAHSQRRADFRCHERGVYLRTMFAEQELRFEDVESFGYSATRIFVNGAYTGTNLILNLIPKPTSGKKKIAYSRSVQNADEALDSLRNHIATLLMVRMAKTFAETGSVQWMPCVRLASDGLYFRPQGFVARKEETRLGYDEISSFDIQQGTFHVWKKGEKKSAIHELVSEPNFFPGYLLLLNLFSEA